jgi:dihydropteroate synthase
MGILNVTPDSFSDGGKYFSKEKAVEHGLKLFEEGADILDIGGKSTRPGSSEVPAEEQIERIIPVIESLSKKISIPISVDTTSRKVADEAFKAGASMINDISALCSDDAMADFVANNDLPIILMHKKGDPATMQNNPHYDDVIKEIKTFFSERIIFAMNRGVRRENIILDPGIGFGKRTQDNLAIISNIESFCDFGLPVLVGHSRKRFLSEISTVDLEHRDSPTLIVSAFLAAKGVHILRVHDVQSTRTMVNLIQTINSGSV